MTRTRPTDTDDTTEVSTDALDMILENALGRINFANPEHEEVAEAVRQLWGERYGCEICQFCVLPQGAGYRAHTDQGEATVCGVHADGLESGDWSGGPVEISPLEE